MDVEEKKHVERDSFMKTKDFQISYITFPNTLNTSTSPFQPHNRAEEKRERKAEGEGRELTA